MDLFYVALLVIIVLGGLVAALGVTIAVLYGRRWRRKVREEGIQGYIGPDGYWHATRPPDNRPPPPPPYRQSRTSPPRRCSSISSFSAPR